MPSKGWAEMIRKVYKVDLLLCPACGGQMSIIAFIEDHKVIVRLSLTQTHLRGWTASPSSNYPAGTLEGSRREEGSISEGSCG